MQISKFAQVKNDPSKTVQEGTFNLHQIQDFFF